METAPKYKPRQHDDVGGTGSPKVKQLKGI